MPNSNENDTASASIVNKLAWASIAGFTLIVLWSITQNLNNPTRDEVNEMIDRRMQIVDAKLETIKNLASASADRMREMT